MTRLARFMDRHERERQRKRILANARQMRDHMTHSESRLWEHLKDGFPTRAHVWWAQKPLGTWFIVDFYCARQRLIIEVDGPYHEAVEQRVRDARRDSALRDCGKRILRFTNEEVETRLALVLHTIRRDMRHGVRG